MHFIVSTDWFGIKMRLEGNGLIDYTETRNRRIFESDRNLAPPIERSTK